ncbi:MAG: hypothetical protein K2W96_13300 [Gemmataceae bacterium]|nr:hypothetical protein [Gemmataceae bacterium]
MRCLTLVLVALVAADVSAKRKPPVEAGKKFAPSQNWTAVVSDNALADEAPKSPVITDAKTFEKLWKAWRKDDKLPAVDFKDHFVLVTLSKGGPNKPNINGTLDDKGNLKVVAFSTLIGGDGFGYSIATFPRKGVKTVNGEKLP